MPDKQQRFVRFSEVQRRISYSRSTINAKIARGEFPPPTIIGPRAAVWLESEIDEWMRARIAEGRTEAPVKKAGENDESPTAVTK